MMKDRIQLKALAKINLGLDVLRRREDGYHEVKMIMQTISLHDDLEIRRIKTPEIQVKTNLYYLPTNENNLVYKAAKLLMDEFGIKEGVAIQLKKRIPVAAGMAGGSTDGAAEGGFYADLFCNDSGEGNIFKERICAAALGVESGKSA